MLLVGRQSPCSLQPLFSVMGGFCLLLVLETKGPESVYPSMISPGHPAWRLLVCRKTRAVISEALCEEFRQLKLHINSLLYVKKWKFWKIKIFVEVHIGSEADSRWRPCLEGPYFSHNRCLSSLYVPGFPGEAPLCSPPWVLIFHPESIICMSVHAPWPASVECICVVPLNKLPNFHGPSPHLPNGHSDAISISVLERFGRIMPVKKLAKDLAIVLSPIVVLSRG